MRGGFLRSGFSSLPQIISTGRLSSKAEGVLCAFFLTLVLAGASAPIGRSRGRGGTLFLILGGKEFVFVHRTRLSGVLSVFLLYAWILAELLLKEWEGFSPFSIFWLVYFSRVTGECLGVIW